MIIKGHLVTEDGVDGCNFIIDIDQNSEDQISKVQLISNFSQEILSKAQLPLRQIASWLYDKKDW